MTELTPERLQELRRIAEAATPGPWDATRYNSGLRFDGPLRVYAGTDPEYGEPRPIPATDADTRYIAAFDPPTVLALLDEIERLHGQLRLATVDQAIVEAEANDARAEALKERIYALEADLDTAQHADHEETIRALVVAADRLAALEAELASMRADRYESRAITHADNCWSWGPKHYKCAVREIRALRAEVAEWKSVAVAQSAEVERLRDAAPAVQGEPVAYISQEDFELLLSDDMSEQYGTRQAPVFSRKDCRVSVPLYASPQPPAQDVSALVEALEAENERLREDAARYRLLRKGAVEDVAVVRGLGAMDYGMSAVVSTYSEEIDGDDLDAAIDEAMEKENSNE